ncbi:AarF/ABC1/UbiB kinase family protein [Alicyclobacillus sp. SO9]|uniref:ABC1 kinase family protein n=1 Tax=Alicyclobacillus sp. SO9 TaxID=2665646 RepID=UPI0018E7C42D|nr:AarF/UbiB family protein [Alicyclobacillus sp. SO9]QQE77665.1 ABC transporter [Alicyclobacillus sp. SO9]
MEKRQAILREGRERRYSGMIAKRVRHFQRYREVARVLVSNGFAWFIDRVGLADILRLPRRIFVGMSRQETLLTHERMRIVLERLGPTFVKVGQVASLRPDLLPKNIVTELGKLQDEVPPFEFDRVRSIVEDELSSPIEEAFAMFEETPLAAASLGQVHQAVLKTGEVVAVKVQRPGVETQIQTDLEILRDIAVRAEKHVESARHYRVTEVVDELARTVTKELDYVQEGRNADKVRENLQRDSHVYIPKVYWEYTTQKVLVMEYVEGIKLSNVDKLEEAGYNRDLLAERAAKAVFEQLLVHGLFHADPHPGNIAALPDHQILFLDFGMVGKLSQEMRDELASLIIALMQKSTDLIVRALFRMGVVPSDVDLSKLTRDIDDLRDRYYDVPLSEVSLGESIRDMFSVAYEHGIRIPTDLTLVGKALLTIEGVVEELDPEFSIMDVAEPFGKRLLKDKVDPARLAKKLGERLLQVTDFLGEVPQTLSQLSQHLRKGEIDIRVRAPELEQVLKKLDRISNRLSFSIILLSLSIFIAGVVLAAAVSKPALSSFTMHITDGAIVVAVLMGVWLIWSIIKSGRL